ncbi:hypothetical protein [Bosea robiniae]|uniref:DUF5723 domain-containing protein n=1 Tax=Bosea robiniae TaxID=1036780 RepID=A0ABY0NJA2_9HYPH|nr:hypothetical protein [Bosea robiniae]SDF59018.1 hypothetical protein SAMN05421844_101966 [Bosea robiniae]
MQKIIILALVFHASLALATEKPAEDKESSIAVIGLRGGFDSNPAGVQGANGTPVATTYATWDYLHGTVQDGYGLNLSLVETHYDPRALASARAHSLTLKHGFSLGEASALQSSLTASSEQSWSRRKSSLSWRERLDHSIGAFRLFASGEARMTALNERNVFNLGDFLPRDENFGTLGLTTGAAWRSGETEIGLSFSAARIHYIEGVDYLGFRRDHNRLQPNLFFSTELKGAAIEASLSPFRAYFPEKEFDAVESLLYTAKLRLPYERFTLDLGSLRTVEDTTLPFSVINLVTAHEAKLTARIDDDNAVSLSARRKTDDYVGLDARSDQKGVGIDYQHNLGKGLIGTVTGAWRKTKETGLTPVTSFSVMLGLQKQIDLGRSGKTDKSDG